MILTIGPRNFRNGDGRTGGIVVLFENWLSYCYKKDVPIKLIDTNKNNYKNKFSAYFSILRQVLLKSRGCEQIFLHGTFNDYLLIAPWALLIGKLTGKKVILRKFAGNFAEAYQNSNRLKRYVLHWTLANSNLLFWETKALVKFGSSINPNSVWFPNVRKSSAFKRPEERPYENRFVFLSRVEKEKGILLLVEAFKHLGNDYSLDVYGPLNGIKQEELLSSNISYKGIVPSDSVSTVLAEYDVLILPTLWKAEGYPGIIIEAYSVGLPVIASRIGAIPEIVGDSRTGFLIEPGSMNEIVKSVKMFDDNNYSTYASNAMRTFKSFDADIVNNHIFDIVEKN